MRFIVYNDGEKSIDFSYFCRSYEYIFNVILEDKISTDQKINVIPSENTCKIVCQLMRVMDLPSGHMLIYGK